MKHRYFMLFRELRSTTDQCGRTMRGTGPGPVLDADGMPRTFPDLDAADAAADAMNLGNRQLGSDYCKNVDYFAGWLDVELPEGDRT